MPILESEMKTYFFYNDIKKMYTIYTILSTSLFKIRNKASDLNDLKRLVNTWTRQCKHLLDGCWHDWLNHVNTCTQSSQTYDEIFLKPPPYISDNYGSNNIEQLRRLT
jgi:hypothetical protein